MSDKGWQVELLGNLAAHEDGAIAIGPFGSSMKSDVYVSAGVPVVRGTNLDGYPGFRGEFVFVEEATAARFARCIVEPGDLVFPHRGAIGSVGIAVDTPPGKWLMSTSMMKFRADRDRLDPLFAFHFFRSAGGRYQLLKNASQVGTPGIGQPLTSLRACEMPVPPIDAQRAIAGVLGGLDNKIEQNRRTARVLERLSLAIFQAWFVDFDPVSAKADRATSFPSMPQQVFEALPTHFVDSDIGPVPEGWEVNPIGDLITAKGGGTPSTKNPDFWDGGEHCWATPKDMSRLSHPVLLDTERRITDAGLSAISSEMLPIGTVLMSSRAPVGYLAIAGVPTAINQGFIAMVCDGPLPPTYVLNWAFSSMDTIKARASGTTFPEISKKTFRPLPAVLPPEDVIGAYRQVVDPLYDLLTACVKENDQLAQLRDYLLPKLLSGEVRTEAAHD